MKKVVVKKNRYVDSVSLMGVSERVTAMQGIENAEAQMATCANQDVLKQLGYELPESVTPNDLVIAITADDESIYSAALKLAEDIIDRKNVDNDKHYSDIDEIDPEEDRYDLCQISLPGEYAAAEAKKALEKGMDLFIFSDNVSLEEELELKQLGQKLGKLVMGPDAGVALIGGVVFLRRISRRASFAVDHIPVRGRRVRVRRGREAVIIFVICTVLVDRTKGVSAIVLRHADGAWCLLTVVHFSPLFR